MDFDLDWWWLLSIPIAFGLGWWSARLDIKKLLMDAANLPQSYFLGLNFLLNEQPDKAIDAFIEVVKLDPETTELHFALGRLFLKRGETERAIRVHQNLFNRSSLPLYDRQRALYELGLDYLKAGLLDRAEKTFHLVNDEPFKLQAQQALLTLYQLEKEWLLAIDVAEFLAKNMAGSLMLPVSHFYCELAEEAFQTKKIGDACNYIEHAMRVKPNSTRARLLFIEIALLNNQPNLAQDIWRKIADASDFYYLFIFSDRVLYSFSIDGNLQEGISLLVRYAKDIDFAEMLNPLFKVLIESNQISLAKELLLDKMKTSSSLDCLEKWLILDKGENFEESDRRLIIEVLHRYTKNSVRFLCGECGFRTKAFYWQCPGCTKWESFLPFEGIYS